MSILLFSTCLIFFSFGTYFFMERKRSLHDKLSSIVMFIAGTLYFIMGILLNQEAETNLRIIRYFDWIITVPILVYQMFMFLQKDTKISNYYGAVICTILMLAAGWLGESGIWNKTYLGIIGTLFSVYTFVVLSNGMKEKDYKFFFSILGIWMFYPIVYFIPDSIFTIIGFCLVDVIAKIGSSLYIKIKSINA